MLSDCELCEFLLHPELLRCSHRLSACVMVADKACDRGGW